jgi:manganese/zinc/iron transport system permease protein
MPDWLLFFVPHGGFGEGWILAVAVMTNVACAIVGCYLVLRRMSLMGDAIAHAVLPGLVVAFLFTGSLNVGGMFLGAFAVGLLTTFLTQTLHRQGGVAADASMGVVFTTLFAIGVVLLRRYAGNVDLDPDCVLQGQLALIPGYTVDVLGYAVPRAAISIGIVLVLNFAFVVLLWKELKITSFDPGLATTMGLRSGLIHYLLMAMVAGTTVAAFEAVGSILVIAMLIVPAATAHLLTDRLSSMLWVSAAIGTLAAYLGFLAFARWNPDMEPAGMIAVAAGVVFSVTVLVAPRYGLLSTLWRNLQTASRIVREDILAMLYRLEELNVHRTMQPRNALLAVGGGVAAAAALWQLIRRGLVQRVDGGLALTNLGRDRAKHLVRSHRLWEAYLVEYLGLPLDHVHAPAERMEHYIGQRLQEQIAAGLPQEETDPHGRSIPR